MTKPTGNGRDDFNSASNWSPEKVFSSGERKIPAGTWKKQAPPSQEKNKYTTPRVTRSSSGMSGSVVLTPTRLTNPTRSTDIWAMTIKSVVLLVVHCITVMVIITIFPINLGDSNTQIKKDL